MSYFSFELNSGNGKNRVELSSLNGMRIYLMFRACAHFKMFNLLFSIFIRKCVVSSIKRYKNEECHLEL